MEVECSVLGNLEPEASVPGEIVIDADWYDYEAKYQAGGMELVVPARLPDAVRERVRALAVDVFRRVDCAGLARCDFFVEDPDGDGRVLVNELNTMPGFTATSVYAKLWEASRPGLRPAAGPAARAGRRSATGASAATASSGSRFSSCRAALLPSGSLVIHSR